ncbi:MAG: multicopper oxidase family protein [Rhodospirillales bacterium]|nr:multicopper oxidase family protein [Rhodospirillales bacterium]MBO6786854.1 multicopper oxidase family protein [Rhodospirillales bacterium]
MRRRDFLGLTGAAALVPAFQALLPRLSYADGKPHRTLRPGVGRAPLMGADKPPTEVWSYNDLCPGPIIRIPRNREVHVRVENALAEPTSVHWHGIRIDNAMDGVTGLTQDPIAPGESFDYRFTSPDAGTFWYHSHHRSWEQVGRGLYGALIVEEDDPVAVDHDLLFIADDWRLDDRGEISPEFGALHDASHGGRLGNWLTVNGDTKPAFKVRPGARVRLRCMSVTNARIMAFAFPGLKPMIAAIDGQPLETPTPLGDALVLGSAQRADLIIDIPVTAGTQFDIHEVSVGEPIDAALLVVDGEPVRETPLAEPLTLPANPLNKINLDLVEPLHVDLLMEGGAMGGMRQAMHGGRMFDMRSLVVEKGQAWAFNGIAGKTDTPLVSVPEGRTLVLNMINDTRWAHAMHMHGHHFRVIERNGQKVTGAPWRDTELVDAGERVRVAFVADNPGKWLFHCHMLEHHMAGMGTWISVG